MQRLLAVIVAAVTSAAVGQAQTIDVSRSGSRDVVAAAPENFTGSVRVETLVQAVDPSHVSMASVTRDGRC
jgi:hypothetical protein